MVVLTSNRTRELHDALKRRCLYHWIDHPQLAREVEIIRTRLPEVSARLAAQVAAAVQRIRASDDILKPPGVAESLDWARALHRLGHERAGRRDGGRDPGCGAQVPRGRGANPPRPGRDPGPLMTGPAHRPGAEELLVGFTTALRRPGMAVTADRTSAFVEAVSLAGLDDRAATYWSGRATLCSSLDDTRAVRPGLHRLVRRHRRRGPAGRPGAGAAAAPGRRSTPSRTPGDAGTDRAASPRGPAPPRCCATATWPRLTERERAQLALLFDSLDVAPPLRRALRRTATPPRPGRPAADAPRPAAVRRAS